MEQAAGYLTSESFFKEHSRREHHGPTIEMDVGICVTQSATEVGRSPAHRAMVPALGTVTAPPIGQPGQRTA